MKPTPREPINTETDPQRKAEQNGIAILLPLTVGLYAPQILATSVNLPVIIEETTSAIVEHFTPKIDEKIIQEIERSTDQKSRKI